MKKFLVAATVIMSAGAMATPQFPYESLTVNFPACDLEQAQGLSTLRALIADELGKGHVSEYVETRTLDGDKIVCVRPDNPTSFNRLKENIESISSVRIEPKQREKPCNQLMEEGGF